MQKPSTPPSEVIGRLDLEVSVPDYLLWIPKGMSVQYTKKATGALIGTCLFSR